MEKCFICFNELKQDSLHLPMDDEYIGQDISIFKNTFIIKKIEPFEFLYYCVCSPCIDKYLNYHNRMYRYVKNREIGKKDKLKRI
tara:strand:+ start:1536 stop:1790 length:255 start_codon:yes stop_codon:yes gene_type:complete